MELESKITELEHDINYIDGAFSSEVNLIIQFLYSNGYLSRSADIEACVPEDVTAKGVMCTEINEANPLLLAELISGKYFEGLDTVETISLLSLFLDVKSGERDMTYSDSFRGRVVVCNKLAESWDVQESNAGLTPSNWVLCDELCDVTMAWIKYGNMSAVYDVTGCSLFEGELVRQLLKLNNICKEVCKAATIMGDDELSKKLEKHQELLIRGVVMPDSLYCL
jgi:antiviral helicase SKI2